MSNIHLGKKPSTMTDCGEVLPKFRRAAGEVWRNWDTVEKQVVLRCEPKTKQTENLASLSRSARCKPMAIEDELARTCKEYVLQITPRLGTLSENQLERILRHEALHIGYPSHSKEFLDMATKVGASYSESSLDENVIKVQRKEGRFYKTFHTEKTPSEAEAYGRQYAREHRGEKVRIEY